MIDLLLFIGFIIFGVVGLFIFFCAIGDKSLRMLVVGLALLAVSYSCVKIETYACDMLSKQPWERPDPYVVHTIMALQDGSEVSGNFRNRKYGISGYINEEFMYVYGYKTSSGGMKIQKVSEKNATVYFNDNVSPNAKWYKETRSFWWLESERYTCDIFIPTDSLQAELVIDLQ